MSLLPPLPPTTIFVRIFLVVARICSNYRINCQCERSFVRTQQPKCERVNLLQEPRWAGGALGDIDVRTLYTKKTAERFTRVQKWWCSSCKFARSRGCFFFTANHPFHAIPLLQARFLLFPILCYSGAHPRPLPFHSWANEKKGLIKTLIQWRTPSTGRNSRDSNNNPIALKCKWRRKFGHQK